MSEHTDRLRPEPKFEDCVCGGKAGIHVLECQVYPATQWHRGRGITNGDKFYTYTCSCCGEPDIVNGYVKHVAAEMLSYRWCFNCHFWWGVAKRLEANRETNTIINHHVYAPGNGRPPHQRFLGMGGRRFDIEYIGESKWAGQKITTFDLWAGSALPEYLWERFPDTAKFEDASKVVVGDITCWNQVMDNKKPEYQAPRAIGIK